MINFNVPPYVGKEIEYIQQAVQNRKICGDGEFTKKCSEWLEEKFKTYRVLLTTSGTSALEMAAVLCDIQPGDEVIMPSYTFVSTANAFVMRGAKIVFIDIRPDTMNIDENLIEAAITEKTKVIVPVHYAGIACEMDTIMDIAKKHHLLVVEDAAQAVMSTYKGRALGTIADFGCYSFHETKNYSMGEGGAIAINNEKYIDRAEIIREKGTNRSQFFRGMVDKYTWVDIGSSYLPSELNAAYLYAQLEEADTINDNRLKSWNQYYKELKILQDKGLVQLAHIPDGDTHNGHMFYIKTQNLEERTKLLQYMKDNGVYAVFHYIPLHSSIAGKELGRFYGRDVYTTLDSERLCRLPMYYNLRSEDISKVIEVVKSFYNL
ncbi:dTDP-4-amino-4,6-dideoxygalactose transaminase [Propionispira raffinosivorans]|uniref:dTDP-4-amino-4,6-dideoxygalactose transaminase n=1 Tax=Propionispira raffinosivorans TaxID=86959 RepID=UPI00037CAFAE|nr:dTDP-4-amino-4,6-dideoxygalactose transaminase [Propionispira raffinosivorans]